MAEDRRDPVRSSPKATRPVKRVRVSPMDRARIGSVVAETYRIDELIGRGAIGAVFGGVHLRLERPVAVKFVDPSLVDDAEVRGRFRREARIAAQIRSSHAVEVFDYGVGTDGAPYIVMERLVGEELHARMLREGPLPVGRALRIAKQVCRALGAAHQSGIVHRDLKPENVFLVERDGEQEFAKVVDFGLSTFLSSEHTRLTRAGQSVGTPLYMAPEQADATAFDARVDVYSLGVLIFEMTTGRLPYEASSLQELLHALAHKAPQGILDYDPTLPVELDALIRRFTARDVAIRPRTAAAALAEILVLEDLLRSRDSPSQRLRGHDGSIDGLGIDGLPGSLTGPFADELTGHLGELRRTGSLSTSGRSAPPPSGPPVIAARAPTPMPRAPTPAEAVLRLPEPSHERMTPARDRNTPMRDQAAPVRDRITPMRDQAAPVRDRITPMRDQAAPARPQQDVRERRAAERPTAAVKERRALERRATEPTEAASPVVRAFLLVLLFVGVLGAVLCVLLVFRP